MVETGIYKINVHVCSGTQTYKLPKISLAVVPSSSVQQGPPPSKTLHYWGDYADIGYVINYHHISL